jgi:hypothetical protein
MAAFPRGRELPIPFESLEPRQEAKVCAPKGLCSLDIYRGARRGIYAPKVPTWLSPGFHYNWIYFRVVSTFDLPPLQLQGESLWAAVPRVETLGALLQPLRPSGHQFTPRNCA